MAKKGSLSRFREPSMRAFLKDSFEVQFRVFDSRFGSRFAEWGRRFGSVDPLFSLCFPYRVRPLWELAL